MLTDGKSDLNISDVRRNLIPNKHLVLGNGESRKWFTPNTFPAFLEGKKLITWGCNAIYRDGIVDNLVSVDYAMQQEIYESEYHKNVQCWFSDWSPLPASAAEGMIYSFDIPEAFIHQNYPMTEQCVISGKDPVTINEHIKVASEMHPGLDMNDLKMKMEKDTGLWITWVKEEDTIKDIDFPNGWSAGSTAIHLACQQGAEEVYMLGFDLSSYAEPINNIYKDTDNYLPASAKGFNPVNWMGQLKTVFKEFQDTQFYWVDWSYGTPPCYNIKNVGYLTKTEFCDKLQIIS